MTTTVNFIFLKIPLLRHNVCSPKVEAILFCILGGHHYKTGELEFFLEINIFVGKTGHTAYGGNKYLIHKGG